MTSSSGVGTEIGALSCFEVDSPLCARLAASQTWVRLTVALIAVTNWLEIARGNFRLTSTIHTG